MPQDFFFLTWLLIIAALSLFFFTALAGRLWCGYACPQTVWTEMFLWMERWARVTAAAHEARSRAVDREEDPARKGAKQVLWITFALWTGFTFVGYFTPIRELAGKTRGFALGRWETFWVLFYGFATYGNAGYMREQVCKYMCPYARFQSAMFDRDTLVITYDAARGEPRGARKRGIDPRERRASATASTARCACRSARPASTSAKACSECIACAACIDACDERHGPDGYPRA